MSNEPIDAYVALGDTPGIFTVEQSKDISLDEFVDFAKYRIKDFDGLLIPDPFQEIDLPELTPEQSKTIIDIFLSQAAREFNERVRLAFRTQFITRPTTGLLDLLKIDAARVEAGEPIVDDYRW